MGTSFEEIMKRMKSTPRVVVPAVTNPKLPTKVERDTEAATERRRAMPNFNFGTGNKMEQLVEHMKSAPHPTPTCPDPNFRSSEIFKDSTLTKSEREAFELRYQAYARRLASDNAKRKQDDNKDNGVQDEPQADL